MKMIHQNKLIMASIIAGVTAAYAGEMGYGASDGAASGDMSSIAMASGSSGDSPNISGSLGLDYNSHFISYGADVWGAGNDLNDALFNPSMSLTWDLDGTAVTVGTWFDINDNLEAEIGGKVQEVDAWLSVERAFGDVTASLTYQAWMYGGDIENIVDLGLSLDAPFAPSLTVHGRLDDFPSDAGAVFVIGADAAAGGDGISIGDLSISIPIAVAAATDGFHGGDSGFAYASAGISSSLPLPGGWDLHGSATYYITDEDVIPNNSDDSFLTLSAGLGFSF